jgi:oligopeptide/dipeptide ABC transporter ATP-binding protein
VNDNTILALKNVKVHFKLDEGLLKAVDGVDFELEHGRTLGIVGESGCGKSVATSAILRLLPGYARVEGEILLYEKDGERLKEPVDIAGLGGNSPEIRSIRGRNIAMIFQEPMKAFSPILSVGDQVTEPVLLHVTESREEADRIAVDIFRQVGISNPEQRLKEYPHQLSGGMRQRAMIAMALASNPAVLIADEPTTALDVTIQAQVLKLINDLKKNKGSSVIFITHDLGVIAEMSDYVAVMYLGKVVEYTDAGSLFSSPGHPYTMALMKAIPALAKEKKSLLKSIPGTVPVPINLKAGCGFFSRCDYAKGGVCDEGDIPMAEVAPGHLVRCVFAAGMKAASGGEGGAAPAAREASL